MAAGVRGQLNDGTLKPGAAPSIARLCTELGVSRKTAARALSALEGEGRLELRRSIGYVVVQRGGAQAPGRQAGSLAAVPG